MPGAGEQEQAAEQTTQPGETPTWETWLEGQDEAVKGLVAEHTKGLKSALESERTQRKEFERQLREAAGKLEKDSEQQRNLTEIADRLSEQERKADFYEAAHAAGVRNLKLAYLVANSDGLFDRKGQVDWAALKGGYPELFEGVRPAPPKGHAGTGTGGSAASTPTMNDAIRAAFGQRR